MECKYKEGLNVIFRPSPKSVETSRDTDDDVVSFGIVQKGCKKEVTPLFIPLQRHEILSFVVIVSK